MTRTMPSRFAEAISSHAPLPKLGNMTLEEAYVLQHEVTSIRSPAGTGGIKAGVTAPPAQKFLGLSHALIGSLYADARLASGCVLDHLPGRMIECELAILADRQGNPLAVAPAIEFVFLKFADPKDMTLGGLVASNLGAELFLVGDMVPWEEYHQNLSVELARDGTVVNRAQMNDSLGDPQTAAKWMRSEALAREFTLDETVLFLAGACGAVVPADRGAYIADYGDLGKIDFEIV